eukprot:347901-Lingulodinium_polyedra.AAC.1
MLRRYELDEDNEFAVHLPLRLSLTSLASAQPVLAQLHPERYEAGAVGPDSGAPVTKACIAER